MKNTRGFTTVELLVTLFIAVAFLMSGYQLYSMIIRDGGEARARAKASNVAYDYLKREKDTINAAWDCEANEIVSAKYYSKTSGEPVNIESLSDVEIQVTNQCAKPDTSLRIVKTTVKVKYNIPQQSVTEATYYATQ